VAKDYRNEIYQNPCEISLFLMADISNL